MAKETTKETISDLKKLMALALDKSNENEARNAAVAALEIVKEHDLVLVPRDELAKHMKVIGEAKDALAKAQAAQQEAQSKMFLGMGIGVAAAKFLKL